VVGDRSAYSPTRVDFSDINERLSQSTRFTHDHLQIDINFVTWTTIT